MVQQTDSSTYQGVKLAVGGISGGLSDDPIACATCPPELFDGVSAPATCIRFSRLFALRLVVQYRPLTVIAERQHE